MKRRDLLKICAAATGAVVLARYTFAARAPADAGSIGALPGNWKDFLAAGVDVPLPSATLQRSDEEWRKVLTPEQYEVLRAEGTERPFTSPLNDEKRAGVFACAGCDLPLFTSAMKYDSGTGWPSFFTTIPGVFARAADWKLLLPRTEYRCLRCGGHQGHVFDDGPPPTGERWCNNGVALKFVLKSNDGR